MIQQVKKKKKRKKRKKKSTTEPIKPPQRHYRYITVDIRGDIDMWVVKPLYDADTHEWVGVNGEYPRHLTELDARNYLPTFDTSAGIKIRKIVGYVALDTITIICNRYMRNEFQKRIPIENIKLLEENALRAIKQTGESEDTWSNMF
jgi:hypothetical protein